MQAGLFQPSPRKDRAKMSKQIDPAGRPADAEEGTSTAPSAKAAPPNPDSRPQHSDDAAVPAKHGPRACFVIGFPRSGTTVLKEMLGTHPAIVVAGEIFNEVNDDSYWAYLLEEVRRKPDVILPSRSIETFQAYMALVMQRSIQYKPQARIVVLDVKYSHSHFVYDAWREDMSALPKVFFLMREKGWLVIDLHRRDLLALVVSNLVAIKSGIYHSTSLDAGAEYKPKVWVDPRELRWSMGIRERSFQRMSDHFEGYPGYLNLIYEEMFDDHADGRFSDKVLDQVSELLAVPNEFDAAPQLRKLLTGDIYDYIENAQEVRDQVRQIVDSRSSDKS